eukprot:TRINITY_DN2862_c0_g1_i1.p1 TRINITY_DN2862_c0_g1~~TRINITY_DN2862_c0_g1_i1.p1  ORF type:complete len:245 (+),score=57.67 TRINITY_DN2862_c0_g1_i1:75-737(+)
MVRCAALCVAGLVTGVTCFVPLGPALSTVRRSPSYGTCTRMSASLTGDPMLKPLGADDYMAVGLALCYVMGESNKPEEQYVFEPLTAGTLETIHLGVETSYKCVMGLKAGDYFIGDPSSPTGVNVEVLSPLLQNGENAILCENAVERSLAAARTMRRRKEGQLVAVGATRSNFNFQIVRKRILNQVYEPSFADNVKQDKSIDVYGRDDDNSAEVAKLENL